MVSAIRKLCRLGGTSVDAIREAGAASSDADAIAGAKAGASAGADASAGAKAGEDTDAVGCTGIGTTGRWAVPATTGRSPSMSHPPELATPLDEEGDKLRVKVSLESPPAPPAASALASAPREILLYRSVTGRLPDSFFVPDAQGMITAGVYHCWRRYYWTWSRDSGCKLDRG